MGHLLHFEVGDVRDFRPPQGEPGVIVCNPPYGERIGEEKELRGVYAMSSRGLTALRDVNLVVRQGEILGIAGVSGNGQSELAEVLTGLRPVEAGEVLVAGAPLTRADARSFAAAGARSFYPPTLPTLSSLLSSGVAGSFTK